jgi:hypothetical protein
MLLVAIAAVTVTATATEPPASAGAGTTMSATRQRPAKRTAAPHPSAPSDSQSPGLLQLTPVADPATSSETPRVVVAIDPGASASRSFEVINRSADLVLTVRLSTVDAAARSGGTVHDAPSASAGSAATWLTLSDVIATLEPRAKLAVSLTVTPPANAAPGDTLASVVAQLDSAVRASDQVAVDATATATLPVAITVLGAPTALVSITGARVVAAGGRDDLEITFQNSGATSNTMTARVNVRGSQAQPPIIRASVAPLTGTTVRVPFAMPSGMQTVPISVVATDPAGDQATWSGSVGLADTLTAAASNRPRSAPRRPAATVAARSVSLPRLVLIVVALGFVAAAVWFGAELRRNRAARRAIPVGTRTPATPNVDAAGHAAATTSAGAVDPMNAVAAQLGALVDAIDRLATRLADGSPPQPATPSPAVSSMTSADGEPSIAESAARWLAPAAPRVPPASPDDLYDWPTEAQLEQFAARRRSSPDDLP